MVGLGYYTFKNSLLKNSQKTYKISIVSFVSVSYNVTCFPINTTLHLFIIIIPEYVNQHITIHRIFTITT